MASVSELQARIADLRSQGKTESTSKKLGKLVRQLKEAGGSSGGGGSFEDTIARTTELAKKAVEPAVQSLQAGIDPLKNRYAQLLDEVKQVGGERETEATKVQAQELGKRGLLPSSTLFQQTIQQALDPIKASTQRGLSEVGFQSEQGIRGILNAIAQLQSQAGMSALGTGANLFTSAQANQLARDQMANAMQQFQAQQEMANKIYENIDLPTAQYTLNKPYYKPEDSSTTPSLEDFFVNWGFAPQSTNDGIKLNNYPSFQGD